ncbi:MAG: NAD(P)-dependent alcohol dehydrogenase [Bryobacteraceae bacterium]
MSEIHALAAKQARAKLEPFSYDPGPLGDEQVEIEVQYCGICHSDVAMLANEFGMSRFPFVPGHEAIGKIVAAGPGVKAVRIGQTVGVGWNSGSCLHCMQCLTGNHNMCNSLEQTIVGRYGAFATRVRCHWCWAIPLPEGVDASKAGPLFCGGVTVFNPLVQFDVRPTDRVGVIGIGGLGHLALQFLNKWGCRVTAFTSSASKANEAMQMGAHEVIDTHSKQELGKAAGSFNFILSTVAAPDLDFNGFITALAPKGRFHIVGIIPEIKVGLFPLLSGQRSISSSPSGAPATVAAMLDFCARHNIAPVTEEFPMSEANEALEHLEAGKARYRIVLKNDLQ